MFFRAVKDGNATDHFLECMDLAYLFTVNQMLDMREACEEDIQAQIEKMHKTNNGR